VSDSPKEFKEIWREPAKRGVEVISPNEVLREILKSNMVLDSLYAIPPLLLNLCAHVEKDSCSYLGYKGGIIPIVMRRTFGIYALAQHSPPQIAVRGEGARRIDVAENIKVLRSAFPALLIKLRQYPFDDAYLGSSADWGRGPRTDKRDIQIDLTNPVRVIYSKVSKDYRSRLRKALNLDDDGVISSTTESLPSSVHDETSLDGVGKFGSLLGSTLRKISSQRDARNSEGFILSYARDYALLRKSFSTLRDCGLVKVFLAHDEQGNPGSGVVVLVSGKLIRSPMALLWLGGSTPEGNRQGLSVALEWAVITWLIRNSYNRYYLGGIGLEDTKGGPAQFKQGFGGRKVLGRVLWYSPFPLLGELAERRDTLHWLGQ
jgi:hypothetical protein